MIYFIDTTRGLKKATTRYAIITAKKKKNFPSIFIKTKTQ